MDSELPTYANLGDEAFSPKRRALIKRWVSNARKATSNKTLESETKATPRLTEMASAQRLHRQSDLTGSLEKSWLMGQVVLGESWGRRALGAC